MPVSLEQDNGPNVFDFVEFASLITVEKKIEYFQRSEIINQVGKWRNVIHFLQKKETLGKWLTPTIFLYLIYPHQQGSDTVKQSTTHGSSGPQLSCWGWITPSALHPVCPQHLRFFRRNLDGVQLAIAINSQPVSRATLSNVSNNVSN